MVMTSMKMRYGPSGVALLCCCKARPTVLIGRNPELGTQILRPGRPLPDRRADPASAGCNPAEEHVGTAAALARGHEDQPSAHRHRIRLFDRRPRLRQLRPAGLRQGRVAACEGEL